MHVEITTRDGADCIDEFRLDGAFEDIARYLADLDDDDDAVDHLVLQHLADGATLVLGLSQPKHHRVFTGVAGSRNALDEEREEGIAEETIPQAIVHSALLQL